MAKKEASQPAEDDVQKGGKGKLIIIIAALLVLALGVGAGAAWFLLSGGEQTQAEAEPEQPSEPSRGDPRYVDFDPDFTVNLNDSGGPRFLQVAISALTYYDDTEEALKDHMPALRSSLIVLFGNQSGDALATLEGKEQLRSAAAENIEQVLLDNGAEQVRIGQVFFTKFIVQ